MVVVRDSTAGAGAAAGAGTRAVGQGQGQGGGGRGRAGGWEANGARWHRWAGGEHCPSCGGGDGGGSDPGLNDTNMHSLTHSPEMLCRA